MSAFTSVRETQQLGSPVIGIFRTALGRDPTIGELVDGARRLRRGAGPADLASALVALPEFQRQHGDATGPAFAAALCRNAFGSAAPAEGAAALGAALGASPADLLAGIATIALAQGRIPLLPGLAPGAPPDDPVAYRLWLDAYGTEAPAPAPDSSTGPCITIAMVAGDTQAEAALRTIASLRAQSHGNWRLHLCARALSPWSSRALAQIRAAEPRIEPVERDALWAAWQADPTALACWLAPGDRLPATALAQVVAAFADPDVDLVYTDEDVEEGGERHSPRFKPAYSPGCGDLLIGQLAVYRTRLLAGLDPAQPPTTPAITLAAHAARQAGQRHIRHLPGVLCHRAAPPPPLVPPAPMPRPLPSPPPRVTALILTRDRAGLLEACLQGLLHRTDYPALEVLIVDNGSTEPETLALLATLAADARVRVLPRPGPFNFAALNNAAAAEATGEILLLLNNDTEILHPDWLTELVGHALDPAVGAVGARLLYPYGTVQHAGILLGPQGRATHVGRHAAADDPGYLGQLACVRDLSAVTGACLALRTAVWHQVGGMDERLAVTWNDVDLCLAVRHAGLRVVWTPHATLLHRESASRGSEAEDPAQAERFRAEQALVQDKWGDAVEHDPFLNANLVATEAGPLCLAPPRSPHPRTTPSSMLGASIAD